MLRKIWPALGAAALLSVTYIMAFTIEVEQKPLVGDGVESISGDSCPLFGDPAEYSAGKTPIAVAVGDFDGDGVQDLAVTNQGSTTCVGCEPSHVSVLLGLGDGSFGAEHLFGVGRGPISIVVEDLDNDGVQDLAVANRFSYDVSELMGLGGGQFGAERRFDLWDSSIPEVGEVVAPQSIAAGDFNGDGLVDLVTANLNSRDVQLLRNRGSGWFEVYVRYEVGYPRWVAVGDFDNDGVKDLAVASSGPGSVFVLLGLGNGLFGAAQEFDVDGTPLSIAVGDFDADGAQDLAVAAWRSVAVLLGLGDGNFSEAQYYDGGWPGGGERSLAIGDFNDDMVQDLAVIQEANHLFVLFGLGDGNFGEEQGFPTGERPRSVVVGDFNRDGAQDLAVTNAFDDTVSILINQCSTLAVDIDIKPHSHPNSINPRSRGVIQVAILGSETFDVADVDETTLRFGPGEAPIAHRHAHFEDVNWDGIVDLVTHHRTRDTGIVCGDESATLTGQTLDGQSIQGSDSINTVGCRETTRPTIWMKDQDTQDTSRRDGPVNIDRK